MQYHVDIWLINNGIFNCMYNNVYKNLLYITSQKSRYLSQFILKTIDVFKVMPLYCIVCEQCFTSTCFILHLNKVDTYGAKFSITFVWIIKLYICFQIWNSIEHVHELFNFMYVFYLHFITYFRSLFCSFVLKDENVYNVKH